MLLFKQKLLNLTVKDLFALRLDSGEPLLGIGLLFERGGRTLGYEVTGDIQSFLSLVVLLIHEL